MTYVLARTDNTKYSATDGVDVPFGTAVEAGAGGFGVRRTVKGVEVFEVLDAMPLNRAATQLAVEAGSTPSPSAAAAGFTAVNFAIQNELTSAEVASAAGIKSAEAFIGDLT